MAHRNRPKGDLHAKPRRDSQAMGGPWQSKQPTDETGTLAAAEKHLGCCTAHSKESATRGLSRGLVECTTTNKG
ncbi:hypothetical protein V6N13_008330 [Hibiscus sabdariffa]